jgi:hypothetical protein
VATKKKENLWELLKRLDEEAAQYNQHLHHLNHYFDSAAFHTKRLMDKHERDLHKTIGKVRKAIKSFTKENNKPKKTKKP